MKVVTPGHGTDDHRAQSDTRFSRHHDSKKEDSVCADELLWDRAPHDASHSRMRVRDRRHLSRHVRRKVASSLAMHHSHTHSRALVTCPSGSDAGPHPSPRRASSSSYRHIYSSSRHPPERPATRHRATCSSHGVGRGARPEAAVPRDGHLLAHRPVARAPLGRVCAGELADVEHPARV